MAPIPMERLKPYSPFFNTSLDLFGALEIKGEVNKRSKGKSFGVIFTFMFSKAVYFYLSQNDSILVSVRRFVSMVIQGNYFLIQVRNWCLLIKS